MKCTIKVSEVNNPKTNLRGFATVVFGDSFKVTNIAILEKEEDKNLFVSMPRYRTVGKGQDEGAEYKDICNPITKEFRDLLYGAIMAAFQAKNFEEITFNDPERTIGKLDFSVQVTPFEREGSNVRGLASIFLDKEFVINHIFILQGKSGKFISMPSYKAKQFSEDSRPVYQDICYPITREFRETLYEKIFEVYELEKRKVPPLPLPSADDAIKSIEKETPFR